MTKKYKRGPLLLFNEYVKFVVAQYYETAL